MLSRFLKYISVDSQSSEKGLTEGEQHLLGILASEMRELGLEGVEVSEHGYAWATIPATKGRENDPVIGFLAHVDTSPEVSGAGVKPQIIENYDGGDIVLGTSGKILSPREFPELSKLEGHTVITTDGTTLLGADDKAGVAIIMTLVETLKSRPEIAHGPIRIAFTSREEVGRGVDNFDVEGFGADFAYTIDGGAEGCFECENFNAASAVIEFRGRNIHPGEAKGKMINALRMAMEFDALLPATERPETTSGREGFFHLTSLTGTVEVARAEYLLRDFSSEGMERRKELLHAAAKKTDAKITKNKAIELLSRSFIRKSFGRQKQAMPAIVTITETYRNMREVMDAHPQVVQRALNAIRETGLEPIVEPIRGGTDGARLSFMGLPCPNIFTGGGNFHSVYEYCSLTSMRRAVEVLLNIVGAKSA